MLFLMQRVWLVKYNEQVIIVAIIVTYIKLETVAHINSV